MRQLLGRLQRPISPQSQPSRLLCYSYGNLLPENSDGPTPGYYLPNLTTLTDSLLRPHTSPAGSREIFNGFDISPDVQILLFPLNYCPSVSLRIIAFHLQTGTFDTLPWRFNYDFLCLRFSLDGQQLLDATYPFGVFNYTIAGHPEISLID